MLDHNRGIDDERLDGLFNSYRHACAAPEASANFMPNLWQKIEARQRRFLSFGRIARTFVTAAVALSLAMAIYIAVPHSQTSPLYSETYIEALAFDNAPDVAAYLDPVHEDEI